MRGAARGAAGENEPAQRRQLLFVPIDQALERDGDVVTGRGRLFFVKGGKRLTWDKFFRRLIALAEDTALEC